MSLRAADEFEDRLSLTPDRIEPPLSNAELLDAVRTLRWEGPLAYGELCWTSEFDAADTESNTATAFKATAK